MGWKRIGDSFEVRLCQISDRRSDVGWRLKQKTHAGIKRRLAVELEIVFSFQQVVKNAKAAAETGPAAARETQREPHAGRPVVAVRKVHALRGAVIPRKHHARRGIREAGGL